MSPFHPCLNFEQTGLINQKSNDYLMGLSLTLGLLGQIFNTLYAVKKNKLFASLLDQTHPTGRCLKFEHAQYADSSIFSNRFMSFSIQPLSQDQ